MALNSSDSSKIGYKAKIEWAKQRIFDISEGGLSLDEYLAETNKDFEVEKHTPEELIVILDSLSGKAKKLEDKIAYLSKDLKIPVSMKDQPGLYAAIKSVSPEYSGEYIDYALYDKLLKQQEFANSNVDLNFVLNNTSGDVFSDSSSIRNQILQGYANYSNGVTAKDNSLQRTVNTWANNLTSWNEHDYNISQILSFSDNYIGMFPDPAYIPWSLSRDVADSRIDSHSLSDVWKYFSADYASRISDMTTGLAGFSNLKLDPATDPGLEGLTTRYINYANKFLNQVNNTFDINFASELVCCFMQWGVQLDLKTLKGMRALLQLLQTGLALDTDSVLNGIKDIINNIFRGLLCNQLLALVTSIMQNLVDPIKKWINNPQDGMWNKLFACTPINELINKYIAESMDYLQQLLTSLIQSWYKKIEIGNIKNSLKVEGKNNQKICGELATMLDWIVAATEAAARCGVNNSPNIEAPAKLINDYKINDITKYEFPVEENPTIWNSFISQDSKTGVIVQGSQGSATISTTTTIIPTNATIGITGVGAKTKTPFEECLKNIPKDQIAGVQEWIAIINEQSQGSVK